MTGYTAEIAQVNQLDTPDNITSREIRKRLNVPYSYDEPYVDGKTHKSWYDVHKETTFYDDILAYIERMPPLLRGWIMARISTAMESGKIAYVTNDAIFAYIDMAHFSYYGYFAE